MARFCISEKIYDTDKMDLVGHVKKFYQLRNALVCSLFRNDVGKMFSCELYRSKKGNFLLVHRSDDGFLNGQAISKKEARELLAQYDYDAFVTIFGPLEEA